ncbi:MAG: hypothetical protein AAGH88_03310 [Planctomycetota bacterium]
MPAIRGKAIAEHAWQNAIHPFRVTVIEVVEKTYELKEESTLMAKRSIDIVDRNRFSEPLRTRSLERHIELEPLKT